MLEKNVDELSSSLKDVQGVLEARNHRRDKLDSLGDEHDNEVQTLRDRISYLLNQVVDEANKQSVEATMEALRMKMMAKF
ncbi:hypothetical protein V6N13_142714 [Hibiscus sabdariffa]